jgi:hypothetical protein
LEKSFHPEPPKEEHQQSLPFGHLTRAFRQASGNQRFQNFSLKKKDSLRQRKLKIFSADKLKFEFVTNFVLPER